jgi:hypothetical protein
VTVLLVIYSEKVINSRDQPPVDNKGASDHALQNFKVYNCKIKDFGRKLAKPVNIPNCMVPQLVKSFHSKQQ